MSWLKKAMGNTYRFTDNILSITCPTTYSDRVVDKAPFIILGCMENDDDIAFRMLDTGEVSSFMTEGANRLYGVRVFEPYLRAIGGNSA